MGRYGNTDSTTDQTNGDSDVDTTQTTGPDEAAASDEGKDTSTPAPTEVAPENSGTHRADASEAPADRVTPQPEANPSDPTAKEVTSQLSTLTQDPGVQTGGLTYTEGVDKNGKEIRNYVEQTKVETIDEPAEPEEASA